jgi:hypothetical protein
MAAAAVISCEETRPSFAKPRVRHQLYAYLDGWVDRLEANMPEEPPSLEALTHAVFRMRQEWTGRIPQALVAQPPPCVLHQRTMPCPPCPCMLPARPAQPRPVHTMVGEVALARPSCYGTHCQQGFAPLDDALQLSERRTPWDVPQAAARLAAEVPGATAQELFTQLTGLSLSHQTRHAVAGELSHALEVLDVSPTAAQLADRVVEMAAGKPWRPVLVWAIDGACVPTRPEEAQGPATGRRHTRAQRAGWQGAWKEATGVRFSLGDRERIVPWLRWDQVGCGAEVGAALRQVQAAGLIPEDQGRVCVIGDGAKWIWNQVTTRLPTAVQILDDDHGRAHGHQVGALQCAEDGVQASGVGSSHAGPPVLGRCGLGDRGPAGSAAQGYPGCRGHPQADRVSAA